VGWGGMGWGGVGWGGVGCVCEMWVWLAMFFCVPCVLQPWGVFVSWDVESARESDKDCKCVFVFVYLCARA